MAKKTAEQENLIELKVSNRIAETLPKEHKDPYQSTLEIVDNAFEDAIPQKPLRISVIKNHRNKGQSFQAWLRK